MGTIRLDGVRARGHHGVLAHEKVDGQDFVVDIAVTMDLRPAAASDDLADTLSYADLGVLVTEEVTTGSLDLIEALAGRIGRRVLAHDARVEAVEVTVHKPDAPLPADHGRASITLQLDRKDLS